MSLAHLAAVWRELTPRQMDDRAGASFFKVAARPAWQGSY
jgi:hypothetical protein